MKTPRSNPLSPEAEKQYREGVKRALEEYSRAPVNIIRPIPPPPTMPGVGGGGSWLLKSRIPII